MVFVLVAEINGLSAVKNGFRAHEAHLGWIKISRNKMNFENLLKIYLNMTKGLLVFVLLAEINGLFKTVQSGSKYLKFQELKSLSVSKDYATSENSLTILT